MALTKVEGSVHPGAATFRDFGAAGDGVTDDYTAVLAALNDTNKVTIDGEGLTYRVDSELIVTMVNGYRKIIQNASFDFTNMTMVTDDNCMDFTGSRGTADTTASNITARDNTITVADTSGYAVGDWIMIMSDDTFSTGGDCGEWGQVKEVTSGTVLTLERDIVLSYSTNLEIYNPGNSDGVLSDYVSFQDCNFLGKGDSPGDTAQRQNAVQMQYHRRYAFTRCQFDKFAERCIRSRYTVSYSVDHCDFRNTEDATGLAYGFAAGHLHGPGTVTNCVGTNLRHMITYGGSDGVVWHPSVVGCSGQGLTEAALDTHPQVYGATFCGGTFDFSTSLATGTSNDGVTMQGAHTHVSNMTLINPRRAGVLLQPSTVVDDDTQVCHNVTVLGHSVDTNANSGIAFQNNKQSGNSISIVVLHGYIYSTVAGARGFGVSDNTSATGVMRSINIEGTATVPHRAVQVTMSEANTIERLNIKGEFRQSATAEPVIFLQSSSGTFTRCNINASSIIGGTAAIRNNSDQVGTVSAVVNEISGYSSSKTIGNVDLYEPFGASPGDALEIASGAITVGNAAYYEIGSEVAATPDNLDTINGGFDGQIITFRAEAATEDITLRDVTSGAGNLQLNAQTNFTMGDISDRIMLQHDNGTWYEISRSNNT